jgi:hypothetical protein
VKGPRTAEEPNALRAPLARALSIATRATRAIPFATLLLVVAACPRSASAQDREVDAERLFREGQKLLEERRFGEACPKFEAAYNKDHSLGTLINLAFCHKEQGAIWYAWLEFREAEVKATELNRPDRRDFAKQRLAELEKQLPKVIIDNPQKVPLSDVLVEDRKVWEAERGAVFAAEAGQRRFIFKARGKKNGALLINITSGSKVQHVVVPDMEDGSDEPPKPEPTPGEAPKPEAPKPEAPAAAQPSDGSTQRTIGWISIGVGGVAAIVGSIEGISTLSSPCSGGKTCLPDDKSSANTSATIADIGFIVAGLGIVGGIALIATAPSSAPAAPSSSSARSTLTLTPRLGPGWASIVGTF